MKKELWFKGNFALIWDGRKLKKASATIFLRLNQQGELKGANFSGLGDASDRAKALFQKRPKNKLEPVKSI